MVGDGSGPGCALVRHFLAVDARTMVCMTHPALQLLVDEPVPGGFVWTLAETDGRGSQTKVVRRAQEPSDSYEAALAAGTHALHAQLRTQPAPAPA
jgi:hypothetical protein